MAVIIDGNNTPTAGGVGYGDGSELAFTSAGTSGQVLTSAGSGAPTWASPGASLSGVTDSASPFETSLGFEAGLNTTGQNNTFVGYQTGKANTSAGSSTAVGYQSLFSNTTGRCTAVGRWSLQNNTTATGNSAFGLDALKTNTTGEQNTAVGDAALRSNSTGLYNTGLGFNALYSATGNSNVGVGSYAGDGITTGQSNVVIGGLTSAGGVAPAFGITTESNRISMGSTSATNAYIQVAWTVVSDARDKMNFAPVPHGLDFVKQLNPVQYQFKETRESDQPHGPVRYGFKAQDILALERNNPVIIDAEDSEKLRYNGESLVPVLVKALQELSAKFDAYVATHP